MAKTYPWLVEMCGGDCFWTGILPAPEKTSVLEGLEIMQKGELDLSKLPELINAGNEGAGSEAAATYLYRISGTWEEFAVRIDRALEASHILGALEKGYRKLLQEYRQYFSGK